MDEFIKTVLSMSVSGTLILLLVLGLKLLYKNKFSRRWQYYIWLIIALRFLLPVTLDTTIVGKLFEVFETTMTTGEDPGRFYTPMSVDNNFRETKHSQTDEEVSADTAVNHPFDLDIYLVFAWSILALVLFVRKITIYQDFIQYIKICNTEVSDIETLNQLSDCEERLHMKTRVELYRNSLLTSPIMIGFFQPSIILPDTDLGDKELSYIFLHELTHYKQKDMFYKWLIQIVVCVHWFNPFVYLMGKEVNKACELSCDEMVISILDEKERQEYGDTLISFLKADNHYKSTLASVTLTAGAEQLKERLGAIINFRKRSKKMIVITSVITAAVCLCFFATGAYEAPSMDNDYAAWKDNEIKNEELNEGKVYYTYCERVGGNNKSQIPVSDSSKSIRFVLIRKDSCTYIGLSNTTETLLKDIAEQCEHMKTLTKEEKELVIETTKGISCNKDKEIESKNPIW